MALNPETQEDQVDSVIENIKNFKNELQKWATQLQALAVFLPLMTIILSAVIGSFASDLNDVSIRVLAFLSALFGVLSTTFQVEKKAKDMRDAFRYLNYSLYVYTVDGDIKKLIEAYNQVESMVGHVQVSDESIQKIISSQNPKK